MKTAFISEKAKSRFNLNFILSPITALVLMAVAETVGYFAFMPLFFIFIDNAFLTLSLELLAFAFISLAIILWARFVEKSPWLGLGIRKKGALKDFLLGWGIGAAMLTTCVLLMWGFGAIQVTSFQFSANLVGEFLILVLAWSIQGTTEELLTRGWMFSSLAAKHNIPVGILVSSLFFTFLHLGNDGISLIPLLDLTLFTILACLVMLKTGNLWVIGGLHAAWNCFQGNVFAFPVSGTQAGQAFIAVETSGPDWLSGGAFGVEGSIISLLIQAGMITWLVYELYFTSPSNQLEL
ncbi:CPBP family intramembrane glutamic endopeptidase [Streptococcus suis]|uniref:CPBP family intramembrane glutamic endopeptidase n=1 Tax=Streptococcus suis TaxID=1307 RepID=UPI001C9549CA|nr:type II CAAX endopeptidase family protein [Streptococcus suis]MBY4955814.1 CPBP family intramembrane metalloprotease [Streptococcus suis]MBY4981661.1 CPBP family intramembrane metalloprotease [Streptococcus suis]MBY4992280.1 CPBP family intramembrane metalloprotease [Streptococcus suis]MBY5007767.1 CPBP family intramembrane metalloprotease [Streptococcus suis]MBY5016717.1 CPBP family intramembrane metalloprotease [Streptococcus suis]